jgi:hypothetical protein
LRGLKEVFDQQLVCIYLADDAGGDSEYGVTDV